MNDYLMAINIFLIILSLIFVIRTYLIQKKIKNSRKKLYEDSAKWHEECIELEKLIQHHEIYIESLKRELEIKNEICEQFTDLYKAVRIENEKLKIQKDMRIENEQLKIQMEMELKQ